MKRRDAYLWLYGVAGCSNLNIDKIERGMSSIKDIFDFSEKTIYNLEGVNDKVKENIIKCKNKMNVDDYKELLYRKNVKYSVIGDDDYPDKLTNIYDAPKVLFYKGDISALGKHFSVGVVGSRKPTVYGAECTKKLARELSEYGADIISGLAIGVDAISHEASFLGKGKTFGVLGSGIDNPLPKTNIWLMNKIVDSGGAVLSEHGINKKVHPHYFANRNRIISGLSDGVIIVNIWLMNKIVDSGGAVLSEHGINKKVHPHYFANRNRIISGLSDGVIIVEAAKKSGALITAEFAAEQGKTVFAVPGSIFSENSKGCHRLIKEGAKLTENIDDMALITAEFAAEQGKTVFAVPGSIFSENSKGCHRLIKEGAKLTENIDDILEEFEVFKFKILEKERKYDTIEKADKNMDLNDNENIIVLEEFEVFKFKILEKERKYDTIEKADKNMDLNDNENIIVDIIRKNGSIDIDSLCLKAKLGIEILNPIIEKLKLYELIFEIEKGVYSMKI